MPINFPKTHLKFHESHGQNIVLSQNMSTARRFGTNQSGLTFISSPVAPTQKIQFKILDVSLERSDLISIGFTSFDPANLQYDWPNCTPEQLKHTPGFWICSLSKYFCTKDKTIFFYATPSGVLHYGANGEEKGRCDKKIETGRPLWAVIDIWGTSTKIQLINECTTGYYFTPKPLEINEQVLIKILSSGRIVLGVTSFDPNHATTTLPQDPKFLVDRPEYWVPVDDPTWHFTRYDEISFKINEKGEMKIWKNDVLLLKVVHVDHSIPLWGFVHLGSVEKIEMTTSLDAVPSTSVESSGCKMVPKQKQGTDCVICCEKETEAALYPCGHMCLCFECMQQWQRNRERRCPICRAPAKDVIKIYK
ncbi:protein neuralized-like [Tribolium castaneum]|uniref:E3 ubiquitin-protein ligase NEURL1B-like protein n=1 Tax=Tribolium castaneum TaxID=7070 RepID=A0A139WHV1_TRICA|nr:E3 ubiquitin-protein ligase NEURL1B-like protein [Tribolium castaneum]